MFSSWATQRAGDAWLPTHVWIGHLVLILLVFRFLWGIVGSSTARFAAWVTWPWTALAYGAALLRGRGRPYLGHNPLGGWMIIVLLVFVSAQALTGLFTVDSNGIVGGPFSNLDFGDPTPVQRALSRWHHFAFNIILGLIVVHVGVNVFYQVVKKDPVIGAMITGRKPVEPFADQPEMRPARYEALRAILCLAAAILIVGGGLKLFGGKWPG